MYGYLLSQSGFAAVSWPGAQKGAVLVQEDSPPRVGIALLGPFEVTLDAEAVSITRRQARTLLAFLALHPDRFFSPAQLAEALSPAARSGGSEISKNQIQQLVVEIHRKLPARDGAAAVVESRAGFGYRLNSSGTRIDVAQFHAAVAQAKASLADRDYSSAGAQLQACSAMWRGDALGGIEEGSFVERCARALEEARGQVFQLRIDVDLVLGRFGDVIPQLIGEAVDERPDEALGLRLALAYYGCHRIDEALDLCRAIHEAAKDQGRDPSRLVREAQEAILDSERAQELVARLIQMPAVPPDNLPLDITHFIGRHRELARLGEAVPSRRISPYPATVLVTGLPAVGKTSLVVAWAHANREHFPDGRLYYDLNGFSGKQAQSPQRILTRILRALDVPARHIPPDESDQLELYHQRLSKKKILLILDNAIDAEQVRPLLPVEQQAAVLVTSRSTLLGLTLDREVAQINLGPLHDDEARSLLERIVGTKAQEEPDAVAGLIRLCGNHPLAIRIVAQRASTSRRQLGDLARGLGEAGRERTALLETADGDRAVATAFSWSYKKLRPAAARAFRLLSLHPGTVISTQAAAALLGLGDPRPLLERLAGQSLLEQADRESYRFHDLVKGYAEQCAAEHESAPEQRAAIERMLDWYLHTAQAADDLILPRRAVRPPLDPAASRWPPLAFSRREEALAWCEAEAANLAAAVFQAAETGMAATAWQLPAVLWGHFYLTKSWSDWTACYRVGLAASRRPSIQREPHTGYGQAWMLTGLGTAQWSMGEPDQAIPYYDQALEVWREIGHRAGQAMTLNNRGAARGATREGLADLRRALRIRQEIGDRLGVAQSMSNLAETYCAMGRFALAVPLLWKAYRTHCESRSAFGKATTVHNMAVAYRGLGDLQQAERCLLHALRARRKIQDRHGQAETLHLLGTVQRDDGRDEAARDSLDEALTLFRQLDDPQVVAVGKLLDELEAAASE
jgi:tetratricopeptide (TPR) repeat protein